MWHKTYMLLLEKRDLSRFEITPEKTVLFLIDVQEKLVPTYNKKNVERFIRQSLLLTDLAFEYKIPIVVSEHYPKGLGATIDVFHNRFRPFNVSQFQKNTFSCLNDENIETHFSNLGRQKVILMGAEAHVCIQLTALDFLKRGYDVFVPEDCVLARDKHTYDSGLQLMKQMGAVLTNSESLFFQLMGESGTPQFKKLSQTLKVSLQSKGIKSESQRSTE